MRKRLLMVAMTLAVTFGFWSSFLVSSADAQCGASCGLICGNRCVARCTGCTITQCGEAAGTCCQQLWEEEGPTGECSDN